MTQYSERELILPTLVLLDQAPEGLTTSDLIRELTIILKPDGHDDEIIAHRRDSDAQTQAEARSCVTVRSGLLRVPAQIGQRRTR